MPDRASAAHPPTERWGINFVDEPAELTDVNLALDLPAGQLQTAWAMRPYYFSEPQQPFQRAIAPVVNGPRVELTVPGFRYHTLLVLRVQTGHYRRERATA